jgi:Raf kinase inhibitor-like YbhB/YbcL family protein
VTTKVRLRPLSALLFGTACAAHAQERLVDVTVEDHTYEPLRLAATDARIQALQLPSGFSIERFAEGLDNPRMIAIAEDGTLYVTQREPGSLAMIRDIDRDGIADVQRVVLSNLPWLHGIHIDGPTIYLVTVRNIYRGHLLPNGRISAVERLYRGLPDAGQHPNRTIAVGPDGLLYVSVGSTCNACEEPNPRNATILRFDANGVKPQIFASGLRNTIGFGWHPLSNRLWGMDNGIDSLGDDENPEELNEIVADGLYGWPFLYADQERHPHEEPTKVTWNEWIAMSTPPVGTEVAHAAPMQLAFYDGTQFPAEFNANAFLANHGSWNRKPPSGYDVQRIVFTPSGDFERFEPFVTGFLETQPDGSHGFFGRPTGVAVAKDGALFVGDDTNNVIYRVAYNDPTTGIPAPQVLTSSAFEGAPATIDVESTAFADGAPIPEKYSDYGASISPPLTWTGVPEGTRSLVLLMEDPTAKSPIPFVHWSVANIDPAATGIPENTNSPFYTGSNSRSRTRYVGPRPPEGDPPHPYHFQLFALDVRLSLPGGFNRHALLKAMDGHVLARGEHVGTYAKP